jgi:ppGpp synthetase/RelA/SpoT-type nucleotidyltranferase
MDVNGFPSKSRIDKAGRRLAAPLDDIDEEYLDLEEVFDQYRESHLQPLTTLTADIQHVLGNSGEHYYIAQRLKRRPQILRKLGRLSVRLTQLQDIGGLRIIVEDNRLSDRVSSLIDEFLDRSRQFKLHRDTDYRPLGRDDSGYRALHKIVAHDRLFLEVQIRTRAQHYWAESVERTSVFYGRRLKEGEGSNVVLLYFKNLSHIFSEIERGLRFSQEALDTLALLRRKSEEIIRRDGHASLVEGVVNEDVVKTLIQKEKANPSRVNNWILVFDWRTANFVTWDIVSRKPSEAVETYARYEKEFPEHDSYEVVLIGSSDVATVQKTHSHYFGLSGHDAILEDLGQSITKITDDFELDQGAKAILQRMAKRKIWGESHGIQRQTLKNHFCKDVGNFNESVELLIKKGLVSDKGGSGLTLNVAKTADIERLL